MGGSGGGGSFSSEDMKKMQQAAEARLKALAAQSTKVLFVCEEADTRSLQSHLERSKVFAENRTIVLSPASEAQTDKAIGAATFLVVFTNITKTTAFIDKIIDKAIIKKMSGVHVQGEGKSLVPSKVTAYRWRSISWDELEVIFG